MSDGDRLEGDDRKPGSASPLAWLVVELENDGSGEFGGLWSMCKLFTDLEKAKQEVKRIIKEDWCALVYDGEEDKELCDMPGYIYPADSRKKCADTYFDEDGMCAWWTSPSGNECKAEILRVDHYEQVVHTC